MQVARLLFWHASTVAGEIPHLFLQFPFPKAAMEVLKAFCEIAGISVDLTELSEQAHVVELQLDAILTKVQAAIDDEETSEDDEESYVTAEEEGLNETDRRRVEQLFEQARDDRSKAYELKRELDRLDVFREYEDRFLDLFKHRE